jgi:hypothetical protein
VTTTASTGTAAVTTMAAATTERDRALPDSTIDRMKGGPGLRAFPFAVAMLLASCTPGVGVSSTSTVREPPATTAPTTLQTTTTTPASTTTTVPIDPAATVTEALAASGANYRFTSMVLVGEQTLTSITGHVDGTSVAAQIETGATELSYVRTAEGEWVTGPDGEWVILEGEPPVTAPLGALADAGQLTLESGGADQGVFIGVLGPAAGAAQGVSFSLTVEGGVVTEIRYEVDTGGEIAQVITTFSDIGAAGTVTKPEGT